MEKVILQKLDFEFSVGTSVLGYPELKEKLKVEIKSFHSYIEVRHRGMPHNVCQYISQ